MTDINPAKVLRYAMENAGDELSLRPCAPHTVALSRESKKHNRPASVTVQVPDEVVKNIAKGPDSTDLLMFVLIPRAVVNRAEVGLVLPNRRV